MSKSSSHPIDVHVGRRLRSRRTILGLSQEELGDAVSVTFQQIQKYERGSNRIGSSRLYEFAKILDVNVGYFFQDYEGDITHGKEYTKIPSSAQTKPFEYPGADSQEVLNLVQAFYGIKDVSVRDNLLNLMTVLANSSDIGALSNVGAKLRQREEAMA